MFARAGRIEPNDNTFPRLAECRSKDGQLSKIAVGRQMTILVNSLQKDGRADWRGRCLTWISASVLAETQRLFLWLPVGVAVGIAGFFLFPGEPSGFVTSVAGISGLAFYLVTRRSSAFWCGWFVLMTVAGFSAAKVRLMAVATPQIEYRLSGVNVSGWLERIEMRRSGRLRLIIRPISIQRLEPDKLPDAIAVSVKRVAPHIIPGSGIRLRATLLPLPPPVRPGGFDFARALYFQKIGGIGYSVGALETALTSRSPPVGILLKGNISRLRLQISQRIAEALPGMRGALISALLVGDRSKLERPVQSRLRDAGLAHLLAISGLHMALMVGTLFWLVRAGLAGFPSLVLNYPIKKWAAIAALLGGFGYLLVSGSSVSTLRAFIMAFVMFFAILVDRPALTMRNVAIAALIILLVMPESLLSAGFQMSFATVIALVAVNEYRLSRRARKTGSVKPGMARRIIWYFLGIGLTTLVASSAAGPIAAYHFQTIAVFGLVSNMLAIPLTGLMLMPAGLVALLSMPFGLEALPLRIAGWAGARVISIAQEVSAWEGATLSVPNLSLACLVLCVLGGLWLCLWQGTWRIIGLAPIAGAALMAFLPVRLPDVLIDRQAGNIGVRGADLRLGLASHKRSRFAAERWLRAEGDPADLRQGAARKVLACDAIGCAAEIKGMTIAYLNDPSGLRDACAGSTKADILVTRFPLRGRCATISVRIDRFDLARHGAHAINITGGAVSLKTVNGIRGSWPWVVRSIPRR